MAATALVNCDITRVNHSNSYNHSAPTQPFCFSPSVCCREEPILTPYWIFYFNLCFPLLLFTKRALFIQSGCLRESFSLCLNIKLKCLCSGPCPDVDGRKATSPPQDLPFEEIVARSIGFLLCFLTSPHLCSITEPGIQTPGRWHEFAIFLVSQFSEWSHIPCLNTSSLRFTRLLWGEQSKLGLSNKYGIH